MSRRKFIHTEIEFGYYDGRSDTVMLILPGQSAVTLEGDDLDLVTAAYFHLRGHQVSPSIKSFGLRKYKNGAVTTITDDRMSYKKRDKRTEHPLSFSISITDTWPGTLRLWVESTHTKMWFNFEMSKEQTEEFGRRLAEAARWDVAA